MFEQLPQLGAGAGGGAQPDPILSILILEMATGLGETLQCSAVSPLSSGAVITDIKPDLIGLIIRY